MTRPKNNFAKLRNKHPHGYIPKWLDRLPLSGQLPLDRLFKFLTNSRQIRSYFFLTALYVRKMSLADTYPPRKLFLGPTKSSLADEFVGSRLSTQFSVT